MKYTENLAGQIDGPKYKWKKEVCFKGTIVNSIGGSIN